MSTFQASKDVLLNVLDVFVKDPLLDWLQATGEPPAHPPWFCWAMGQRELCLSP